MKITIMQKKIVFIAMIVLLTSCSSEKTPEVKKHFTDELICKAALSAYFNLPPESIKDLVQSQTDADYYRLVYLQQTPELEVKESRYEYECKLENNQVLWSSESLNLLPEKTRYDLMGDEQIRIVIGDNQLGDIFIERWYLLDNL